MNKSNETIPFSIKLRFGDSCSGRNCCCPHAYKLIDDYFAEHNVPDNFRVEEHESGPELHVIADITATGLSIIASITAIVTAIIVARKTGVERGDSHYNNVTIEVRKFHKSGNVKEEKILTMSSHDPIDEKLIRTSLNNALKKWIK
jgi:hypothetical protein